MAAKRKSAKSGKKPLRKKAKAVAKPRVQPIPAGYSSVIPCFRVVNCAGAISFLQQVFGAKVLDRHDGPQGMVLHAELRIGEVVLMCGDAHDDAQTLAACVYVDDCDAVFEKAVRLGAKVKQALADQFYGDRSGRVLDEWSNEWIIATHIEDVSREELERRMHAMMSAPHAAAS